MESRLWQSNDKVKIKICGIKNIEFAYDCYELGVSALGFHLWEPVSGGVIDTGKINSYGKIISLLPKEITSVLVTTITDVSTLFEVQKSCGFDTIQLHVQLSEEELKAIVITLKQNINVKIIGVVSMSMNEYRYDFASLFRYYTENCDGIILDKSWIGGSGLTYDWNLAALTSPF